MRTGEWDWTIALTLLLLIAATERDESSRITVIAGQQNAEQLLAALDPQQREVALQVTGPLCVRAGAGTGKTRAITYRIAYGAATGAVDPSTVLAVTFTSKAAAEMGSRLRALGAGSARAMTFHAAALRQLSYFWPSAFGGQMPVLLPHKAMVVASAAARVGISSDRSVVRDLAAEVEWAKVSMVDADGYPDYARQLGRSAPADLDHAGFARFFEAYEQAKDDRGGIDFEDILVLLCGVLESREDIAAQVRSRYRSFVVDEYQDVSPVQQHLLDLWRGDRTDLCVVGDVAQTIYSFTGASAKYLEDFPKRMKGARVIELVRDYRSTPQVVALANHIVASSRGLDGRSRERGLPGAVRLVAQQPSGPPASFTSFDTDEDEAKAVADQAKKLNATGIPYHEIAILYRTNSQSEALEAALAGAQVPFQVHGGKRFFDREEVKRAVLLLRQLARLQALSGPGPATQTGKPDGSNAFDASVDSNFELIEKVEQVVSTIGWTKEPPKKAGAVRERWANLDALVDLARKRPHLSLEGFVAELQERAEAKAAPAVNGVVLSTLHGAKGLEWQAVFLVGVSEGLLPISLAATPEAVEEERRLLYVGITRAKEHLAISYALSRGTGRNQKRKHSRFLDSVWPDSGSSGAPARNRAQASKQRRANEAESFKATSDEQTLVLFEVLRSWRAETAKVLERPAFTILPDTSLRDISLSKPRTLRQLGSLRGIGPVKLDSYGTTILRLVRSVVGS